MRRTFGTLLLTALCLTGPGCRDTRGVTTDSGTPPPGSDGGTVVPPPPPGGLTLTVESAAWIGEDLLVMARVGNGSGGAPVPLEPSYFALRTVGGLEVTGASSFGSNACSGSLAVSPGSTFACALSFPVPPGQGPESVTYRAPAPDDRMATGPVSACSPSAPSGLCSLGSVCMSGSCVTPCGAANPTGPCASPSEACDRGECVPLCSASEPFGYCAAGACRDGVCDASCRLAQQTEECFSCLSGLYEAGSCPDLSVTACDSCVGCPLYDSVDTCTCETEYCDTTCTPVGRAAWDCVATLCPGCLR